MESDTGRMLGTVDPGAAPSTVHEGAVHLHQGESYVVDSLDLDEGLAHVHAEEPEWTTQSRVGHRHRGHRDRALQLVRGRDPRRAGAAGLPRLRRGDRAGRRLSAAEPRRGRSSSRCRSTSRSARSRTRAVWYTLSRDAARRRRDRPRAGARLAARRRARRDRAACRSSRPATAGTSAASRRRCTPTPAGPRCSSTTGTPAAPGSPTAGTRRCGRGWRRPATRSPLRVPVGLPVVRAVAEVRQRQRPAGQGRRGRGAHGGAGAAAGLSREFGLRGVHDHGHTRHAGAAPDVRDVPLTGGPAGPTPAPRSRAHQARRRGPGRARRAPHGRARPGRRPAPRSRAHQARRRGPGRARRAPHGAVRPGGAAVLAGSGSWVPPRAGVRGSRPAGRSVTPQGGRITRPALRRCLGRRWARSRAPEWSRAHTSRPPPRGGPDLDVLPAELRRSGALRGDVVGGPGRPESSVVVVPGAPGVVPVDQERMPVATVASR